MRLASSEIKKAVKYVEIIIMAIFTKLFTTSMVANNNSGLSSRLWAYFAFLDLLFFIFFFSAGEMLKKPDSLADIKPEHINNSITTIIPIINVDMEFGFINDKIKPYL